MTKPATEDRTRFRGFASMDSEKVAKIAQLGGKTAHILGRAHQFTKEEASAAGKKGAATRKAKKDAQNAQ